MSHNANTQSSSKFFAVDSLLLAASVFVVFGCVTEAHSEIRRPTVNPQPVVATGPIGGYDGVYRGSSFTGHRSMSEFGLEIQQRADGFTAHPDKNTRIRITTYSYLRGDASMPRRVRVHAGSSCFHRGQAMATQELHPTAASHNANGVSDDYFAVDFSLAERVLVHEVFAGGQWAEANCTVTQPDRA